MIWVLLVVSVLFVHVLAPLGLLGGLPFMLAWWLWVGGLSVLVLPLVALGWDGLLMVLSMISSTGTAGRLLSRSTSDLRDVGVGASQIGMQLYMTGLLDVLTFSGLVRGIWGVVNWVYQCVYFGLRMWLVFVLHAFSVGCFMSLWDGFAGAMGLGVLALGGILGAAVVLGGMCLGYLGIQVYVYVSFMCSFLYYCTMGWYRGEAVDVDSRSGRVALSANRPSVSFGLVKSSRSMYGGRNSVLVAGLPTWVCMIVICFGMFAGLGFGAVADTLLLGMVWVVLGWVSVGAREKALISGGTIDRAGTLTAFAWLLLFEVAFFFGAVWVLWIYCLDGGYGCVGFGSEGVDSGVGSLGKVELLTTGLVGAITMSTVGGSLTIVQVPVIGSLIILLLVTLLMQLLHREVIIHAGVLSVSTSTRLPRSTLTHACPSALVATLVPIFDLVVTSAYLPSVSFDIGLHALNHLIRLAAISWMLGVSVGLSLVTNVGRISRTSVKGLLGLGLAGNVGSILGLAWSSLLHTLALLVNNSICCLVGVATGSVLDGATHMLGATVHAVYSAIVDLDIVTTRSTYYLPTLAPTCLCLRYRCHTLLVPILRCPMD